MPTQCSRIPIGGTNAGPEGSGNKLREKLWDVQWFVWVAKSEAHQRIELNIWVRNLV